MYQPVLAYTDQAPPSTNQYCLLLTQYHHISYSNVRLSLVDLRWAQLYFSLVSMSFSPHFSYRESSMRPFVIVTTVLCRKHQKVIKLELIERIEQHCCFVTFETMPWQFSRQIHVALSPLSIGTCAIWVGNIHLHTTDMLYFMQSGFLTVPPFLLYRYEKKAKDANRNSHKWRILWNSSSWTPWVLKLPAFQELNV